MKNVLRVLIIMLSFGFVFSLMGCLDWTVVREE